VTPYDAMPPPKMYQNCEILPHALELCFTDSNDGIHLFLRNFDAGWRGYSNFRSIPPKTIILHPLTLLTPRCTCHLQDIQTFNIWSESFEMDTTSLEEQHILE
jgi:hypothetical protein